MHAQTNGQQPNAGTGAVLRSAGGARHPTPASVLRAHARDHRSLFQLLATRCCGGVCVYIYSHKSDDNNFVLRLSVSEHVCMYLCMYGVGTIW